MKTLQTINVPLDQIYETPFQARLEYPQHEIEQLAETLVTTGQLQNGVGRAGANGLVELFIGCRRLRATKAAGLALFEVKVVEATDAEVLEANLVENAQRVDLKPLESAGAALRMLALRDAQDVPLYNERSLAQRIGKDHAVVSRWLALLKAPDVVKGKVNEGAVALEVGAMIGGLPPMLQDFAVAHMINRAEGPMGLHEGRQWIGEHCRRDLRRASFDQSDRVLLIDAPACDQCPLWGGNREDVTGKNRVHVCLGPDCFERKQAVAGMMAAQAAGAENVQLIEAKEALRLFDDNNELRYDAPYIDLKKRPDPRWLSGGASKDKAPLWGTILKDSGAPVFLAFDHAGTPRHLVLLEVALAAARLESNEFHVIFGEVKGQGSTGGGGVEDSATAKERKRLDEAEKKGRRLMLVNALGDFSMCLRRQWDVRQMQAVARLMAAPLPPEDMGLFLEVMAPQWDGKGSAAEYFNDVLLDGLLSRDEMFAVLGLLFVIHDVRFNFMTSTKVLVLATPFEFNVEEWIKNIDAAGLVAREQAEAEGPKKKRKKKGEPKMESRSEAVNRNAGSIENEERGKDGAVKVAASAESSDLPQRGEGAEVAEDGRLVIKDEFSHYESGVLPPTMMIVADEVEAEAVRARIAPDLTRKVAKSVEELPEPLRGKVKKIEREVKAGKKPGPKLSKTKEKFRALITKSTTTVKPVARKASKVKGKKGGKKAA